jgi:hypothetical protein
MCSTKHEIAKGSGKKRRQSSFAGNARKEGGRTLIEIPLPAKKASLNFMHNQLLSPLLNIFPINTPPPPIPSPPRHQPQTLTILKQPCLGKGPKGMKPHKEISQRPKKHEYHKQIS